MIFVTNTALSYETFISCRPNKVWFKLIQLLKCLSKVSHPNRFPPCELTLDVWKTVLEVWPQVTLYLDSLSTDMLLIVLYGCLIFQVIQFAKSWVPKEHRQHRLIAVPALILGVRLNLPLT